MSDLEQSLNELINKIPNSVSGDGKSFVAMLKNYLRGNNSETSSAIEELTNCEQVTGVTATEVAQTSITTGIAISFNNDSVTNYASAEIWRKDGGGEYSLAGSTAGTNYTFSNAAKGTAYTFKVVAVNSTGGSANFDEAPTASVTAAGIDIVPGAPKQFTLTWDNNGPLWQWLYDSDEFTDYFELRLDNNAGSWDSNGLARTRDLQSRAEPTVRSGTAYLFVRNVFGKYGSPATHTFALDTPSKPSAPVITKGFKGISIAMQALPVTCIGYVVEIDSIDKYETAANPFILFRTSGSVAVRYCFTDQLGRGEWSDSATVDINTLITTDDIDDNAITGEKILANAVTSDKILAGAVTTVKLDAQAVTAEKIKGGTITAAEIASKTIIGDNISAGAINTAQLHAGAVTTNELATNAVHAVNVDAKAITAEKMDVANLSSVSAIIGTLRTATTGARVEISDNLITVYDANNVLRVRMGVW